MLNCLILKHIGCSLLQSKLFLHHFLEKIITMSKKHSSLSGRMQNHDHDKKNRRRISRDE